LRLLRAIDEVRIYDRALPTAEIQALDNAAATNAPREKGMPAK